MTAFHEPTHVRICRLVSQIAGLISLGVSLLVLAGWWLRLGVLTSIAPGMASMKPNTAACFILVGMALWLMRVSPTSPTVPRTRKRVAQLAAAVSFVISGTSLAEHLLNADLGLDTVFFSQTLASLGGAHPGRMAPATSLAIVLLALAILLLDVEVKGWRPAQGLALVTTLTGFVAFLGYVYSERALYATWFFMSLALHTALLLLFTGIGTLFARPDRGPVSVVTSDEMGGWMARRLLPVVVLLPVTMGWLRIQGQRSGMFSTELGVAVFGVTTVGIFVVVVWTCAFWLNRLDTARGRAEKRDLELAAMVDASDDAIIGKDLDGIITAWNKGAEGMYGYREDEVLGKPVTMLVPPSHAQEIAGLLEAVRQGRVVRRYETVRLRKDGEQLHVSLTISPVRNSHGVITGASTVAHDIAEQKRASEAVRESQSQLRGIIQSAMDAVITVNQEQKVVLFNDAAEKMFQCPAAEAMGKPLDRFIPQRYRAAHSRHIKNFSETGITNRSMGTPSALRGLRADGSEFPLEASISQIESNGRKLYTAIVRDVTERDRAAQALLETKEQLRLFVEHAPAAIAMLDNKMNYIAVSRRWISDYSLADPNIVGRNHYEIFSDVPEAWKDIHRRCLAGEVAKNDADRWPRADGGTEWVRWEVRPWYKNEGVIGGLIIFSEVITERKHMEEQLLQSQKMQALGTLAGGIAHDFNNILLAIGGNATLALDELPPDHPAQHSLKEISKAGARATNLVRQILAFSRRQEPNRKVIKLEPVVREALGLLRATLPSRIEIQASFASNLLPVSADSTQLHQIVMNLGTNAARAIGETTGKIVVTAQLRRVDEEFAAVAKKIKPGVYDQISFSDSGCGMDRATLERIFDPFYTTQAPGQGTGLGLSVVHGIMKDHDGAVTVYSEPDKGSVFHLYFPVVPEKAEALPEVAIPAIPKGQGARLLYVDDEEALVLLAKRALKKLGYEVDGFTDPAAALEAFREHPEHYDVVVTDLSMPGMTGPEMVEKIQQVRSDVPVVMASGYIRPEDQKAAARLGIQELILKPDTIDDLAHALHRVLTAQRKLV